jgi:hypothetical protein
MLRVDNLRVDYPPQPRTLNLQAKGLFPSAIALSAERQEANRETGSQQQSLYLRRDRKPSHIGLVASLTRPKLSRRNQGKASCRAYNAIHTPLLLINQPLVFLHAPPDPATARLCACDRSRGSRSLLCTNVCLCVRVCIACFACCH